MKTKRQFLFGLLLLMFCMLFAACNEPEEEDFIDESLTYTGKLLFSAGVTTGGRIIELPMAENVTLCSYKKIKIPSENAVVSDETVEAEIKEQLSKYEVYDEETKTYVTPELTDELVEKYFTEYGTAKKYRKSVKDDLENELRKEYLKVYLLEHCTIVSYPETFMANRKQAYEVQYTYQYTFYNDLYYTYEGKYLYDTVYDYYGITEEQFIQNIENEVLNDTKCAMIMQAICEAEKIKVREEDIKDYIYSWGYDESGYNQLVENYGRAYFAQLVLIEKALDYVADKATIE